MVEIVNRQRKYALDLAHWEAFTARALGVLPDVDNEGATVLFVSNAKMRELNRAWRGKDYVTDVLSFPLEQQEWERAAGAHLGDIVICVAQAARQAQANGLTLEEEVAQLILHGLLHLCGYDHETDNGEMNQIELSLREALGI
jgi:probable rRNA maturation factor